MHEKPLTMTILVVFHKLGEFVENLKARVSTGKWTTAVHCVSLNTVAPALFKYVKYNSQQTTFTCMQSH